MKATTVDAVGNTIKAITKIDHLSIKHKYKTNPPKTGDSKHTVFKWWFVVVGEESLLLQLEQEWAAVKSRPIGL